jgi:hypothetical protein
LKDKNLVNVSAKSLVLPVEFAGSITPTIGLTRQQSTPFRFFEKIFDSVYPILTDATSAEYTSSGASMPTHFQLLLRFHTYAILDILSRSASSKMANLREYGRAATRFFNLSMTFSADPRMLMFRKFL